MSNKFNDKRHRPSKLWKQQTSFKEAAMTGHLMENCADHHRVDSSRSGCISDCTFPPRHLGCFLGLIPHAHIRNFHSPEPRKHHGSCRGECGSEWLGVPLQERRCCSLCIVVTRGQCIPSPGQDTEGSNAEWQKQYVWQTLALFPSDTSLFVTDTFVAAFLIAMETIDVRAVSLRVAPS